VNFGVAVNWICLKSRKAKSKIKNKKQKIKKLKNEKVKKLKI
jgi:hypothetical protein